MARVALDKVLKKKKLSKNAFAKKLGVLPSVVRPFFHEDANPKLQTLALWARVLDCKISELYDESKNRPARPKVHK
ncbi:helix-turn-helix domain-containing protein [Bdellovibrio bacteriovorus]|uniref:helix-turn-helix domain-containing protein n=1 Tax=Bdellovibrio bacteriovorus TaxID=959 RepID=UPI0035A70F8E